MDDEAGVEPETAVLERVDVAARPPGRLEDLDLVRAGEQVGRAKTGDARSDDRDPHGAYSNRPESKSSISISTALPSWIAWRRAEAQRLARVEYSRHS